MITIKALQALRLGGGLVALSLLPIIFASMVIASEPVNPVIKLKSSLISAWEARTLNSDVVLSDYMKICNQSPDPEKLDCAIFFGALGLYNIDIEIESFVAKQQSTSNE